MKIKASVMQEIIFSGEVEVELDEELFEFTFGDIYPDWREQVSRFSQGKDAGWEIAQMIIGRIHNTWFKQDFSKMHQDWMETEIDGIRILEE